MEKVRRPSGQGSKYYARVIIRKDPCVWCGSTEGITTDHVHPISFGGPNHWSNYAPACQDCNQRKGNQSVLEFLMNRQLPKGEKITLARMDYESFDFNVHDMWFDPFGLKRRDGEEVALRV